jgi:hypothetical protein
MQVKPFEVLVDAGFCGSGGKHCIVGNITVRGRIVMQSKIPLQL